MITLTDAQKERRREQALVREAKKREAWIWREGLWPRWAYFVAIPNGGVLRRIEKILIHEPIPDER